MVTHKGSVVPVRQEFEAEKAKLGWFTMARESDIFDVVIAQPPAMDVSLLSNPRRVWPEPADREDRDDAD